MQAGGRGVCVACSVMCDSICTGPWRGGAFGTSCRPSLLPHHTPLRPRVCTRFRLRAVPPPPPQELALLREFDKRESVLLQKRQAKLDDKQVGRGAAGSGGEAAALDAVVWACRVCCGGGCGGGVLIASALGHLTCVHHGLIPRSRTGAAAQRVAINIVQKPNPQEIVDKISECTDKLESKRQELEALIGRRAGVVAEFDGAVPETDPFRYG